MLSSSVLNSVTFKDLTANTLPNKWNTLHANRKQGAFSVLPYWQRFDKGDVIRLQFTSNSATAPQLKSYIPLLHDTNSPTATYNIASTRYFFNFEVTLDSHYTDKTIYFIVTQGSDTLTSEPIKCEDLDADIAAGLLRYIKYTNHDRNNSDLSDHWMYWLNYYQFFYIEAVDIDSNDMDESEVLEGAQNKELISANLFSGITLKTGGIPDYMALKLAAASSLDSFSVNGIEYVKEGGVEQERFGSSTLVQVSIKLTAKNIIGLNVDDLGIDETGIINNNVDMPIVEEKVDLSSTWSITVPAGYIIHGIWAKHAATSVAATSVMTVGTTIGGSDIIDEEQGSIARADYSTVWMPFPRHYLKSSAVDYTAYFTVTGSGSVLHVLVHLESLIPTA
jgi:hypothetical protein